MREYLCKEMNSSAGKHALLCILTEYLSLWHVYNNS